MQYRNPHDAANEKTRKALLDECFPLPIVYTLINNSPTVEAILWIALPHPLRALLVQALMTFNESLPVAREGTVAYGLLTLATPNLDEAERRALYLHRSKRCAKNRRDLVAMLVRTEQRAQKAIDFAIAAWTAVCPSSIDETPAYTGFQFMLVAAAMKGRDDFDLFPMLSTILDSMGLPDDSIQGETIDAKAVAFGNQIGINYHVDSPFYAASAGATLH
ncbi:TPA: hypothetical protein QDA71_002447 [Burkholderia vietnamiensis]|uniref:hypothetical protein n=1 Tax=Burkholderia TaxID=32008 RepID=UPI00075D3B31|nr:MULTISPECIES: hypothetical protein [Burkholderia]KVS26817.1 hypothetical protein WK34_13645 [Burkholderia vietnamiensis]MBR8014121.1 hypothetical protein [Burkholderia vietnamiensis]MDR5646292.1 hypothetical protein [Burkholderia cenocepacia]UVS97408.1 hypothetical protein EFP19_17750 [Burkholderia glumae]HDR8945454.1 hypothetical protein [Burkholderia vietnamiensis]